MRADLSSHKDEGSRKPDTNPDLSPATRLFLLRHGQTALNAAGVLRGRLDPPLDPVGVQEAKRLGMTLADRGIRLIVSSPLRRAVETAEAAAVTAALRVEIDSRLTDRDYGEWAGQPKESVEATYGSIDNAPGVEPIADVRSRALEAVTDLARRAAGETAVAVSHDVVLRLILAGLDPGLGDPEQLAQDTACFNTVDYRDHGWTVVAVNQSPAVPETRNQP
jgi:broad specificity phosphatase PhoE